MASLARKIGITTLGALSIGTAVTTYVLTDQTLQNAPAVQQFLNDEDQLLEAQLKWDQLPEADKASYEPQKKQKDYSGSQSWSSAESQYQKWKEQESIVRQDKTNPLVNQFWHQRRDAEVGYILATVLGLAALGIYNRTDKPKF